ncbi:hypothetical protein [Actinoplanes sp. NPDC051851]|uniref:hypothetical protein n=1 Tax=Actinoplanes sp. NPDC051851 TaxID=3154753 RepID=UPI00343C08F7
MTSTSTDEPTHLDVDQALPDLTWLQPGRTVLRHTDNTPTGRTRAWLPCHDNQSVTLPAAEQLHLVRCRTCARLYHLWLHDHGGNDFTGEWTVHPDEKLHESTPRYGPRPF